MTKIIIFDSSIVSISLNRKALFVQQSRCERRNRNGRSVGGKPILTVTASKGVSKMPAIERARKLLR